MKLEICRKKNSFIQYIFIIHIRNIVIERDLKDNLKLSLVTFTYYHYLYKN